MSLVQQPVISDELFYYMGKTSNYKQQRKGNSNDSIGYIYKTMGKSTLPQIIYLRLIKIMDDNN